ncbi:MAG: hypothetical protein KOO69_05535 [Victivallales bacterium]|nr:hypothetical protein [Victivallales bacterium]
MSNSLNKHSRIHLISIFVVLCGFILGVRDALFRELWFDEALTVGEFMYLPTIAAIYRNYVIPNNHIVYTIFLKFWNEFYSTNFSLDFYWRLFTVLTAAITVGVMFQRWRKRYGIITLSLVLFAFTYSLPFEIYATALRGYMLSMLWIVLSFEFARFWVFKTKWHAGLGYFIFCLLAVGTIPSNLFALAGVVIFFFPYFGFKQVFKWKFIYLAVVPLAAAALFYLPLSRRVAGILKLNEGWDSKIDVIRLVYSSFMIAFLPLIIAALAGGMIYFHRAKNRKFLWILSILLIPVPVIFLRTPAPFPRVFITLWPLWILLLCAGLKHLIASSRIWKKQLFLVIFLLGLSVAWGAACHKYNGLLSRVFHGEQHLDDFFSPYYMSSKHKPWALIQEIKKTLGDSEKAVYLSFNSEPCVIVLYSRMTGILVNWIFDKPQVKVLGLSPGSWIVIKQSEKIDDIKKRFGIKTKPLFQNGVYLVFQVIT